MVTLAVFIAGAGAFVSLPLEKLPDVAYPKVTVETAYPGLGAAETRSVVTIPVEDALSSVKGVKGMKSMSRDGSSLITLDFEWGVDPDAAAVLVREAMDAAYPFLPQGAEKPSVIAGDPDMGAHAVVALRSKSGGNAGIARNVAEYELRSRFRRIDGAGAVMVRGGAPDEARVSLDLPKALSRGVTAAVLARTLMQEASDIPAGNIREQGKETVVVSAGRPVSIEELSNLALPSQNGFFRLSDIARVRRVSAERKSVFVRNGIEYAALEIFRQPGADPVRLSREIRKTVDEAARDFPDMEILLLYEASGAVTEAARNLALSALLGAGAVVFTLFLFIKRLHLSLLTALSIPASIAAGLCALFASGRSLNSMSMSGLALGIGLASDTSVIVLDVIHRRFASRVRKPSPEETGEQVASVSISCLAGTLTTAVVFVPIIFLPGPLGALFGDLSVALTASIGFGWVYAQFLLPSLYLLFWQPPVSVHSLPVQSLFSKLFTVYAKNLKKGMRRPTISFVWAAALCAVGTAVLLLRPAAFVSADEAREVEVRVDFPAAASFEAIAERGLVLSAAFSGVDGVADVFGSAGAEIDDTGRRASPNYRRERLVLRCLLEKGADADETLAAVRRFIETLPQSPSDSLELIVSADFPLDPTERLLGLADSRLWMVQGTEPEELHARAKRIADMFLGKDALRGVYTRPEVRVEPNREAAAYIGASVYGIAESLYAATKGMSGGSLEIGGKTLDIRVDAGGLIGGAPVDLGNMPVARTENGVVFLESVTRIDRRETQAQLMRINRADTIYLAPPDTALTEFQKPLPGVVQAGESLFVRYRFSLVITVLLVVFLLYMVMAAQFESFILPGVIMLCLPFALAGIGPALLLTGSSFDSGAVLGMTALFGLVVNNGIVLYEMSEEKMKTRSAPSAFFSGALDRFRPILITTLTTVFSLVPLAATPLASSQRSLASAMLGGALSSTFLTLLIIPSIFLKIFKYGKKTE